MPWSDINEFPSTSSISTATSEPVRSSRAVPVVGKIRPSGHDTIPISIRGRVGNDPELLQSPSGKRYVRLRVATTRRGRDEAGNWHDIDTTWYTVYAWNQLASNIYYSLRKGHPVVVWGRLTISHWRSEEKGTKGTDLSIAANSVGHDLNLCVSQCMRPPRENDAAPQTSSPSEVSVCDEEADNADEELEINEITGRDGDKLDEVTELTGDAAVADAPAF